MESSIPLGERLAREVHGFLAPEGAKGAIRTPAVYRA
jgi:hypothetical protein